MNIIVAIIAFSFIGGIFSLIKTAFKEKRWLRLFGFCLLDFIILGAYGLYKSVSKYM